MATFGKRLSDENVKVIAEPGGFSGYLLKGAVFFFFFKELLRELVSGFGRIKGLCGDL